MDTFLRLQIVLKLWTAEVALVLKGRLIHNHRVEIEPFATGRQVWRSESEYCFDQFWMVKIGSRYDHTTPYDSKDIA